MNANITDVQIPIIPSVYISFLDALPLSLLDPLDTIRCMVNA